MALVVREKPWKAHGRPKGFCSAGSNMPNMGSHVAFVKSKRYMYTPSVNTQLDYKWQKHGHMGSQKAFGSKLSFLPAGCLHLGMVKLSSGPPVWLTQILGIGLVNGFCCMDQVVEVLVPPPLVYHLVNGMPILFVVVVDQAVRICLPASSGWIHGFG